MAEKNSQAPGGTSDPLPNNFSARWTGSMRDSTGPKISGSESGGNATGPALSNKRGQQQNG